MTLRPQALPPVPEATVAAVQAAFPKGNLYVALRTEFGSLYDDQLFADLYPPAGRPVEVAPWRLALVMVMQYLEGLTDRPRPSEGQFFGQVGDEHFVSRCDETKWCTFRAFFVGERGYQTLLLRLSLFLRNALAACGPFITPDKYWRKITWPEFQPSLPPGRSGRGLSAHR